MKQNMNIGTRINGGSNQGTDCSSASAIQKYCYNNIDAYCDSNNNPNYPDGGLYQWSQAMCGSTTPGVQGICPDGWHIPTDAELCTLEQTVDSTISCDSTGWRGTDGGTKLKPNGSSGFEGNLAGYRQTNGSLYVRGQETYIWSSLEGCSSASWLRQLHERSAGVYRNALSKLYGYSIRRLKD